MTSKALALPMCEVCSDPGKCCRRLHLDGPRDLYFWKYLGTPLYALVKMAEMWLPFLPIEPLEYEVEPSEGGAKQQARSFFYSCVELRPNGRCGIYEDRPQLCRDFEPGSNPLCVYHVTPEPSP